MKAKEVEPVFIIKLSFSRSEGRVTCLHYLLFRPTYGVIDIGSRGVLIQLECWGCECDISSLGNAVNLTVGDKVNIVSIKRYCCYFCHLCTDTHSIGNNMQVKTPSKMR